MHIKTLALVLSGLALAGCAGGPPERGPARGPGHPAAHQCELPQVPQGAVYGHAHGRDIATWPPSVPQDGCQRVWHGDRSRPGEMGVLATYHYRGGHVERLTGRVPGGPEYECRYQRGQLDARASRNPQHCPSPRELERRR